MQRSTRFSAEGCQKSLTTSQARVSLGPRTSPHCSGCRRFLLTDSSGSGRSWRRRILNSLKAPLPGFQGSEDRARELRPDSAARGWEAHVHTNTATRRSFSAARLRMPSVATVSSAPCPPPTYSLEGYLRGRERSQPFSFLSPPGPETNLHNPPTSSRGTRAASQDHAPLSPPMLLSQ